MNETVFTYRTIITFELYFDLKLYIRNQGSKYNSLRQDAELVLVKNMHYS